MRRLVHGHTLVLAMLGGSMCQAQVSAADGVAATATPKSMADQNDKLLPHDPLGFLEMCLKQGAPRVRDFRCTFIQNGRVGNKLTGRQVIDALYRREPRSVYLRWVKNPQRVRRTLWVKGRDLAKDGTEQLRLEPSGVLHLIVKNVLLKMDDPRVLKDERLPITAFGPDATLQRIVRENREAQNAGHLDLQYQGQATFDGRPTHLFVRKLPYSGPKSPYFDAVMVLHVDQEWLIPLSVTSYTDHDRRNLLESDEFTQVQINIGLNDADFSFD